MKTIRINAADTGKYDSPAEALTAWFDLEPGQSLYDIQRQLQSSPDYVVVEVFNWPDSSAVWQETGLILESIQQHSSTFFLIWGTQDDLVNVSAPSAKEELVQERP